MLLRFLIFFGLGIDMTIHHETLIAIFAFATPFAGPLGMINAIFIGFLCLVKGYYVEAALSLGILLFNLIGNKIFFNK